MEEKKKERLWFCSDYGLENKQILKRLNEKEEKVFIATHEKEIKWDELNYLQKRRIKESEEKDVTIYGVGVTGKEPKANVVTVKCNKNESVIEQVSKILGIRMNLDEQFISAYAQNGTDGIKHIAEILEIDNNMVESIIENIIIRDEYAKGITLKEQAEMAQKVNSSRNKKQTDYETIVAIDEIVKANRKNDRENEFI